MKKMTYFLPILFLIFNCQTKIENVKNDVKISTQDSLVYNDSIKTAHILVALCDNKYQGIVPVPAKIGNGQDPNNNLYWGAGYGVRTYFKKSKDWELLKQTKIDETILERLVFKHKTQNFYLIADAYDGKEIEQTTIDFLKSSSGQFKDTIHINDEVIGINGNANLITYIGHDGLMDFQLKNEFRNSDKKQRDVIILACYSKRFFGPLMQDNNVNPIVWTSHLMAPEAYIIHDALEGYVNNESNESIRNRAAMAYSKYQKCSLKAARNLLITDW